MVYVLLLCCILVCTLFLAGGKLGLKIFWTNNITPALTALGT
jgi:hypothetical protein